MFEFFKDGNKTAKESFYTVHHLPTTKRIYTGKNVKIGVIDWLFGDEKSPLFAGSFDATGVGFVPNMEHGFAMANTLHEVAPDSMIFAINGITRESLDDDIVRVEYLERALDWAIANGIQILSYSHKPILDSKAAVRLKKLFCKAEKHNIITIFLHSDYSHNIVPIALDRKVTCHNATTFNIYQYDYNFLNPIAYQKWLDSGKNDNTCFLSWSSMAPVLAGFISILLEIQPNLTPKEVKNVLEYSCGKSTQGKVPNMQRAIDSVKKSKV